MPHVSVVVAARNEATRIADCVTSLLAQDGVDHEVIVVDDGSTDGTSDVLATIGDPRLVALRNGTSRGRGAARNRALEVARGEIIAIQDADDLALPGKLQTLARMLEDTSLVAVGGQCISRTASGRYWLHAEFPLEPEAIAARLESGVMGVCHTASAIRRSAMDEAGGYSADFPRAQDLELFRRLNKLGSMRNTDAPLVVYRHPVLLPWSYWNATRDAERRMTGRPKPIAPARAARYTAANLRRTGRFLATTRAASALHADVEPGDSAGAPAATSS